MGAKASEEKKAEVNTALATALRSRDDSLAELSELARRIDEAATGSETYYTSVANAIRVAACKHMSSKKDVTNFTMESKKHAQAIFKRQSVMLQEIKNLKQERRASLNQNSAD